jgi:hypothetical protein
MVAVKDAVSSAIGFAASVLGPSRTADIQLEEVDTGQVNGDDVWLITLSMQRPQSAVVHWLGSRDYKTFTVHKETGEVLAMRIRELAGA